MIKNQKATSLILLVILSMVFMSILSPSKVFAENGGDNSSAVTKDIFSDFDINIENSGNGGTSGSQMKVKSAANGKAWQTLLTKYKGFITGVAAVAAVTMLILFIIQFMKLGASAGNPSARAQAIVGVLWTGIATAGLGAAAIITAIFYNSI